MKHTKKLIVSSIRSDRQPDLVQSHTADPTHTGTKFGKLSEREEHGLTYNFITSFGASHFVCDPYNHVQFSVGFIETAAKKFITKSGVYSSAEQSCV